MAAGDISIKGWSGTAGDYGTELTPEFSLDFGRQADGVHASRSIRRRIVCLTKNVDLAFAEAKTKGSTLTVPVINADGSSGTMTFTGQWRAGVADVTEYATGYSMIVMPCIVNVIPAFSYDLPELLTVENDESDSSVIHLKYNDTSILSWDAGDAADGTGLSITSDLHLRRGNEDEKTQIINLRLYAHGVLMEQFAVAWDELPADWFRGSRAQTLFGPVRYPDGALDEEGLAALAAQVGCEVSDIKQRIQSQVVKASSDNAPAWISTGQVQQAPGSVFVVQDTGYREFATSYEQTITYYRNVNVYERDQGEALRLCRELGLRWVKTDAGILKLMYGQFVWHQWDVSALEPE